MTTWKVILLSSSLTLRRLEDGGPTGRLGVTAFGLSISTLGTLPSDEPVQELQDFNACFASLLMPDVVPEKLPVFWRAILQIDLL